MVWPHHKQLDGAREGVSALGTTKQGIGPAYGDKGAYRGIRVGDLLHPDFLRARLEAVLPLKNHELAYYGLPPQSLDDLLARADRWRERFGPRIVDCVPLLHDAVEAGQDVLLEGQLGIMRDIDWGVYPYTTASSPTAGGACAGSGIPPQRIDAVIGVTKAYCTSVGGGPFPTELLDATGDRLREVGDEYGATTRRPRRCGWYDAVGVRLWRADQRLYRTGHHQAGRAGRLRDHSTLHRLSAGRRRRWRGSRTPWCRARWSPSTKPGPAGASPPAR